MCDTTVGAYKAIEVIKIINNNNNNNDIVPRDRKISVFFFSE